VGAVTPAAIAGVTLVPLKQMEDARGGVFHMLRCDSPVFSRFGEIYFSLVFPGVVKAWKRHKIMTQHFAVPMGRIRLAVYDDRPGSPSLGQVETFLLGRPDHYFLLRIPPLVWYGFQGLGEGPSLVANCTDLPHDPQEVENRPLTDPPVAFNWEENHGPA
jgi:dTDP-4-dehydrorhamnose 3,5-epimerase